MNYILYTFGYEAEDIHILLHVKLFYGQGAAYISYFCRQAFRGNAIQFQRFNKKPQIVVNLGNSPLCNVS